MTDTVALVVPAEKVGVATVHTLVVVLANVFCSDTELEDEIVKSATP
jgi:hypothetical protein